MLTHKDFKELQNARFELFKKINFINEELIPEKI